MVLLTYLFLHLTNHALGLWSLELAGHGLAEVNDSGATDTHKVASVP